MALKKILEVRGRAAVFPGDDVDTDRIIPARFMKCVTFDGLGEYLFRDVRFGADGNPTSHPINRSEFQGASILLVGNNFGCGSSREHAPQALYRFGYRAIVGEGFAEIFFGNSTTLGMPCVTMPRGDSARLRSLVESEPTTELVLDLKSCRLRAGALELPFELRDSARTALVEGRWDAIGELLEGVSQVKERAKTLPYLSAA